MHLNIQHLYPHMSDVLVMLSQMDNKPNILGFSETFLSDKVQDSEVAIPGYSLHRRDRGDRKGGGIAVYISEHLPAIRRPDLEHSQIEAVWLEVRPIGIKPMLVCHIYRSPSSQVNWFEHFEHSLELAQQNDNEVVCMGDFNVDIQKNSGNTDKLSSLMESFQFDQLIKEPTRVTTSSATLIDHVYVTCPEKITFTKVLQLSISDHFAVVAVYANKSNIREEGHKFISYRDMKRFNHELFLQDMAQVPWHIVESYPEPDDALGIWYKLFNQVLDAHAPVRRKRVKRWHQPKWITPAIIEAIHIRDHMHKKGQTSMYKQQRNKVKRMVANAKRTHYKDIIEDNKGNYKKLWQCIKELSGSKKAGLPTMIKDVDGDILDRDADIGSAFNDHFTKLSRDAEVNKVIPEGVKEKLQAFVHSKLQNSDRKTFFIPTITTSYVSKQLKKLDTSKAKGMDEISPFFLKLAAPIIAPSLTHVFNRSLVTGKFPNVWKCAKVTPLLKKGPKHAKESLTNYRPISVLSCISKIIERHVHENLYEYLSENDLLYEGQSGFRPKHSCATALTDMTDKWVSAIDDGQMVGVAFVDLRKAFDSVHHNMLINKLEMYGCSSGTLSWFQSYLGSRSQVVNVRGHYSDEENILRGVPQGSILGPLLFVLFVNDFHLHLTKTCSNLYADDTNIYATGKSVAEISCQLTEDMGHLWNWCTDNDMYVNVDKTKCMLMSTSQKRSHMKEAKLVVNVENMELDICNSHRLLGVHVNNVFSWDEQVKDVSKTVNYYLSVFKKMRKYLPERARIAYCNGCILSHIDYCNTVWGNTTVANTDKLQRLQKRAARMIFDDYTSLPYELYSKLNWLPFTKRVEHNKAVMVYKCLNNNMPTYLSNLFEYQRNTRYNLRSEEREQLVVPKPRLELYIKQSFSYSGAKIWNSMPVSVKNSDSVQVFKKKSLEYQAIAM
jgi:exonuclease III